MADLFFMMCLLLNVIKISLQYYDMKFGHIYMNYYNTTDCVGPPIQNVTYSIENEKVLYVLNSASNIVAYPFSFDFFSTTIYYSFTEGEDDDDEDDSRRAFLCNGLCYARRENADILVGSYVELAPSYEEEGKKLRYYSCVFNNIIQNATIKLDKYSDKHCKTKLENDSSVFDGNQSCWTFDNYSYRPLYFEDDGKRIYYHLYTNTSDCVSTHYEYFDYNGFYFECDKGCYQDKNDPNKYYKCEFNSGKNMHMINILYLVLLIFTFIL